MDDELPYYPRAQRRMLLRRRNDVLDIVDDGSRVTVRIHAGPILTRPGNLDALDLAYLRDWHTLAEYKQFNWPGIASDLIDCLWAGLLAAGGVEQWADPLSAGPSHEQFDHADCAGSEG